MAAGQGMPEYSEHQLLAAMLNGTNTASQLFEAAEIYIPDIRQTLEIYTSSIGDPIDIDEVRPSPRIAALLERFRSPPEGEKPLIYVQAEDLIRDDMFVALVGNLHKKARDTYNERIFERTLAKTDHVGKFDNETRQYLYAELSNLVDNLRGRLDANSPANADPATISDVVTLTRHRLRQMIGQQRKLAQLLKIPDDGQDLDDLISAAVQDSPGSAGTLLTSDRLIEANQIITEVRTGLIRFTEMDDTEFPPHAKEEIDRLIGLIDQLAKLLTLKIDDEYEREQVRQHALSISAQIKGALALASGILSNPVGLVTAGSSTVAAASAAYIAFGESATNYENQINQIFLMCGGS